MHACTCAHARNSATGSVIAALKLAEKMDSKPLMLPGRDMMNMGMGAGSLLGLDNFMSTGSASSAGTSLAAGTLFSGALGLHMTVWNRQPRAVALSHSSV